MTSSQTPHKDASVAATLRMTEGDFESTLPHDEHGVYADTVVDAAEDALRFLVTCAVEEDCLELLRDYGEVRVQQNLPNQAFAFKRGMANADGLFIDSNTRIDAEVLQDCKRLKVIACTEPGHQNIDLEACRKRGIEVIFAAEANAQAVSEYVLSAAFMLRRKLFINPSLTQGVAAGEWQRDTAMQGQELFGATLGLIGFQDMASQRIAYLAQALGMRVCGFDPGIAMDDPIWAKRMIKPQFMADLLRTADIVSLHLPRSVHTRRLIDGASFSIMKPSAILISANAGGVVNEQALAEALRDGQIAGAALDVFDREPMPDTAVFKDCPNLLLTPHIAGLTQESAKRVSRLLVERVFKSLDLSSSTPVSAAPAADAA